MKNSELEEREMILLVDDDPVARVLTASVLESHGLDVVDVESGEHAIARFESVAPHCVVLDALMPGLDGFDTCRRLRALPGGAHIPILMLTGLEDEDSVARAYEVGATDFFVKSQQWTLLAQRVRYLLRSSRMRVELERSRARLAKAQALAKLGNWDWDLRTHTLAMSAEVFRTLGLAPREGRCSENVLTDRLYAEDLLALRSELQTIVDTRRPHTFELRVRHADGRTVIIQCEAEVEAEEDGHVVRLSGTTQDITQRKEAEMQIRALANFDALTQLPNRRMFSERFAQAISEASVRRHGLAILFVDLDRFKHINDTQGHTGGDALLVDVAGRLVQGVRVERPNDRGEDVVARLGGDEFVVLLGNIEDRAAAERVADRLLERLREPFIVRGVENYLSACVGIACYPEHGNDPDTLMQNADAAMYAVKSAGRNGVRVYAPEMTTDVRRRWAIETDLHKALERREFELYYQPQVDVHTGRVIAVEALMRWNRNGQVIGPSDFIPVAQDCGMIIPMGEWALEEALRQARAWFDDGLPEIRVAVNIPSTHFQRGDLCGAVRRAIQQSGVAPHVLEVEITETVLMQDLDRTMSALVELTQMGVNLSVDDFGTGYSSLAYLKRFPLDTLKIDRSFVGDLTPGSDNEAIVAAILAMARTLGLKVVAEGVETEEQAKLLSEAGCQVMQGYYYSRPVKPEVLARLMRERLGGSASGTGAPETSNKVVALSRAAFGRGAR